MEKKKLEKEPIKEKKRKKEEIEPENKNKIGFSSKKSMKTLLIKSTISSTEITKGLLEENFGIRKSLVMKRCTISRWTLPSQSKSNFLR